MSPLHFAAGIVLAVGVATTPAACDVPNAGPAKPASVDWPADAGNNSDWQALVDHMAQQPPGADLPLPRSTAAWHSGTCPNGVHYEYSDDSGYNADNVCR